jgi:hypothetical protein
MELTSHFRFVTLVRLVGVPLELTVVNLVVSIGRHSFLVGVRGPYQ